MPPQNRFGRQERRVNHGFVKGRSRQANLAWQAWGRRRAAPCSKGFVNGEVVMGRGRGEGDGEL